MKQSNEGAKVTSEVSDEIKQRNQTELVDTHCHIQFEDYGLPSDQVITEATSAGVTRLLSVGCTLKDSRLAVELAARQHRIWAAIGLHPHEAQHYVDAKVKLNEFDELAVKPKVVAIGECGLDYFYTYSPKPSQKKILEHQIELAQSNNLPLIFHVREAFDDFWEIFDRYSNVKGVVHSFTGTEKQLQQVIERGLYIGLNGIVTFTKNPEQIATIKKVPLDKLVLETDAPFLTPTPYRGTINVPKFINVIADFLGQLRQESFDVVALTTTQNALKLFDLE